MTEDERYMMRCLELAANGIGNVAPNPMVGAVIVSNGKIIGEGFHARFGGDHAEVAAIKSVKKPDLLQNSTIYINLEPCNHHGKTPPCTDAIIKHKIGRVVIGSVDKNPLVSGKGIDRLKEHQIDVNIGVLEEDCLELNKRFFTFHHLKRPYIILKWAESGDGFMAPKDGTQQWISNEFAKKLVHKWRTEEQAILVGAKTALIDNPHLTARLWPGNQPLRIVIDNDLKISKENNLYSREADTLVFNNLKSEKQDHAEQIKIDFSRNIWQQIFEELFERDIQSLIVEGGKNVLDQLIESDLYDEIRRIIGSIAMEGGLAAPKITLTPVEEEQLNDNLLKVYRNKKAP